MKNQDLNPHIRVTKETHKDLKIIAAHSDETMLEVVARLARQERERIERASHEKSL